MVGCPKSSHAAQIVPRSVQRVSSNPCSAAKQWQREISYETAFGWQLPPHCFPEDLYPEIVPPRVLFASRPVAHPDDLPIAPEPNRALSDRPWFHDPKAIAVLVPKGVAYARGVQSRCIKVTVPEQDRPWPQFPASMSDTAGRPQNRAFVNENELAASERFTRLRRAGPTDQVLRAVVGVYHDAAGARLAQKAENVGQGWAVTDWHQRFGKFLGERA